VDTESLIKRRDEAYERNDKPRQSRRISPSTLGQACSRQGFYDFRWVSAPERKQGRMLRLFETGKNQEVRMLDDLKGMGWQVFAEDPENPGKQISITSLGGHLYGNLDGIARDALEAPDKWLVIECKTHNKASFDKLKKKGVTEAKPEHHAQMQLYMGHTCVHDGLYYAVCKDDESVYF
jgi:hypothetical protein